ncbi:MAG: hypothetical protein JZU47_11650 [Prolixibacteraceae bacterium]|nr:hypothetical protein [Prolixibacteraceae bacterium]
MEFIQKIISENPLLIFWYLICITIFLLFQISDKYKRKSKYKVWKRESINLGFYKREYERDDDLFNQQLWVENSKLIEENKLLKKEKSKLALMGIIFLFILILKERFKVNKIKTKY